VAAEAEPKKSRKQKAESRKVGAERGVGKANVQVERRTVNLELWV
jgi:hypothetical protein